MWDSRSASSSEQGRGDFGLNDEERGTRREQRCRGLEGQDWSTGDGRTPVGGSFGPVSDLDLANCGSGRNCR